MIRLAALTLCLLTACVSTGPDPAPATANNNGVLDAAAARPLVDAHIGTLPKRDTTREPKALRQPRSVADALAVLESDRIRLFPKAVDALEGKTDVASMAMRGRLLLGHGEALLMVARALRIAMHIDRGGLKQLLLDESDRQRTGMQKLGDFLAGRGPIEPTQPISEVIDQVIAEKADYTRRLQGGRMYQELTRIELEDYEFYLNRIMHGHEALPSSVEVAEHQVREEAGDPAAAST